MGLREEKKARTRAALVGAAERLFAEKGYDGTTVADIAAGAGVSTRTFFGYFRAKEDVLFAGADERLAALAAALGTAGMGGDGTADMRAIVERVLAASDDMAGPDRLAVLFERPELRAQAMQRLIAAQRLIAEWLRRTYPERMDARISLGTLYASANRRQDARRVLVELVSRQPAPETYLLCLKTLHVTEDVEGEKEFAREARRLFPKDPRFTPRG